MHRTLLGPLLILFAIGTPARAVELPTPVKAALSLFGTIETPRMLRDMCVAHSPDTADAMSVAYASWEVRRGSLIDSAKALLEARREQLSPLLNKTTEGQISDLDGVTAFLEREMQRNAEARGDEYMDQVCSTYPQFLESIDHGFAERLQGQVEVLRSLPTE